jgi:hypothetical protein
LTNDRCMLNLGYSRCRSGKMGEGRGLSPTSVANLLTTGINFVSRAKSATSEKSEVESRLRIGIVMDREDDSTGLWDDEISGKGLYAEVDFGEGESDDDPDQGGNRVPGGESIETLAYKLSRRT